MNRIFNFFLNPFVISIPVVFLIIWVLPNIFNKYDVQFVRSVNPKTNKLYYHDLNHNFYSEFIYLGYEKENNTYPCIKCWTDVTITGEKKLLDQYNFSNKWVPNHDLIIGDYNNDNSDELYVFTYSNDSLFLMGLDPLVKKSTILNQFISLITIENNLPDFYITDGGFYDLNSDGFKEFVFCINAGHSLEPRAIFAFDIQNEKLITHDVKYALIEKPKIGYDSIYRYIISTSSWAPENAPGPYEELYCDAYSWLFVFNEDLDFLFPPIEQKRRKSSISSIVLKEDHELFIYAIFRGETNDDTSWLIKYNRYGKEVGKTSLFQRKNQFLEIENTSGSDLYLYNRSTNIVFKVTPELKFVDHKEVKLGEQIIQLDIDSDGKNELITFDYQYSQLIIYQQGFKHPVFIDFLDLPKSSYHVSKCNFIDSKNTLFFQNRDTGNFYRYSKNFLYYFKFPFYLGMYLLISLFLHFLLRYQKLNLHRKFEQEKKMTELELLTIKNQIDPHFTFNAINTLSSIFFKEDKKSAHEFLVDFSSLIRNTLNHSKKIAIPLKDELDFVQNYLKLQQFRYSDKFDFKIQIDKEVNHNTMVPRMIIQTFAENSVKHGLVNKEGKGSLTINIHSITGNDRINQNSHLQIEITDDGIGREKSKQVQNYKQISTGKGHDIIQQIVEMYNRLNKTEVSFEINDLKDVDGKNNGTKVSIVI